MPDTVAIAERFGDGMEHTYCIHVNGILKYAFSDQLQLAVQFHAAMQRLAAAERERDEAREAARWCWLHMLAPVFRDEARRRWPWLAQPPETTP